MAMNEKLLHGVIVPMITPLTNDRMLDREALQKLIEAQIGGGVDSLFLAGTTGEGPALSEATRIDLIVTACRIVASRVPVVVAALSSSQEDVLETLRFAKDCGASAAAIAPPYYMDLSEIEITRYGRLVAEESPLPVYLYNVPNANLPRFSLDSLRELCELPNIRGLKDSSGNLEQLRKVVDIFKDRADCSVLVGPEHLLLPAYQMGAHGGVSGGANIFPKLYTAMYRAAQESRWSDASAIQDLINRVEERFYHVGMASSSLIRGLKAAGFARSLCGPAMTRPYVEASAAELADVKHAMDSFRVEFDVELSA